MYTKNFHLADDLIEHLSASVAPEDRFGRARFAGYVAVSAVTVLELSVKQIFCDFASRRHVTLGFFVASFFERINGRVRISNLRKDYLMPFGGAYLRRFDRHLAFASRRILRLKRNDVRASYENLITWRNEFAHGGKVSSNATFDDVVSSYEVSKTVLACLDACLARD